MANFKTRIKQKNDTTEHWNTANATGFKPLQGEIIVYNDVNRIKIGDGTNTVSDVPFLDANCVHLTGNETIDGFKTFKNHITINGSISNSNIMLSATDAANNPGMAGEITWHDGEGNDGAVYIPQGQGETLATCYQLQGKHFQPFAVGDDLSGQTLYFNNQAVFGTYFQAQYTILTSSGGYSVAVGGPPNINLAKNGTHVATFYNFSNSTWLESYTLPSDFGNIETLDTKGGSDGYDAHKSSIWYTLGLGPVEDYTTIDVKDVYDDIRVVEGKIPSVLDSLYNSSTTDALSANQGRLLNLNKAPNSHASSATTYGVGTTANYGHVKIVTGDMNGKANADGQVPSLNHTHSQYAPEANPTFTGTVTLSGNTTPLSASGNVGAAGQVLTSQGMGKSPTWKDISTPSNMVTTDTAQTISGTKTFSSNTNHTSGITSKRATTGYLLDCCSAASGATSATIFGTQLITPGSSSVKPVGKVRIGQSGTECAIELAGSEGTSGQVLTSQGSNKTPIWKTLTVSAPSNMVTTDTAQTITGKKTITEAAVSYLTVNNGLYTYSSYGTFGQALISGGGKAYSNRWKTITASDNISISYSIGTASSVGYGSGNYGTYTSISFTGYKVATDILNSSGQLSSTKYIHVYTTEFTKNVASGRWVHFKGWRSGETILSVIVTPSKNTTAGYGPRLISWFTGANVYVATDDDNDEKGFSITVITQDS